MKGLGSSRQLLHSSTTRVNYWPPVWPDDLFSYIFSFLLDFHARPFKLSKQTFNLFWSLLFWLLYVIFVIIYIKKRFFFNSIILRFFHLSDWVLIYFIAIYFILDKFKIYIFLRFYTPVFFPLVIILFIIIFFTLTSFLN